ncbi:MAG TPA: sensor domain-containing diguanylate cyclase [Armatimonadetes bacterium]|nr:sensor domain-containing diguanylate cyclase [Armatimonadota bacterium]
MNNVSSAAELTDFEMTLFALNYATRMLASTHDPQELLYIALDTFTDFAKVERAAIFLLAEDEEHLRLGAMQSGAEVTSLEYQLPVDGTPLGMVLKAHHPHLLPAASHPIPQPAKGELTPDSEPMLCLPLIGRNTTLGVINLTRRKGEFTQHDINVLTVVATLVAVNLENARLFEQATTDGLTGLYVRRYFEIRLHEELMRLRRREGCLALIMCDLDHFKRVNDTYGHQVGDCVLQEVAGLLQRNVRHGVDIPCRYGGEEFVIVLPETDLAAAEQVAERLRAAAEAHSFPGPQEPLHLTLSLGVAATSSGNLLSEQELVHRADSALYRAKEAGRNCVCRWSE